VTITSDGKPVASSDGVRVLPEFAIAQTPKLDTLFVVGPNPIPKSGIEPIIQWLRRLAGDRVAVGGIDTGSYFMARAGLLDGYRCTIHWEDMDALLDRFPRLVLSPKLFEVDRDRLSCSGGIAALDMMIYLIGLGPGGRKLAAAVSELLVSEHRGPDERQRIPLRNMIRSSNPKLLEAVTLMESNVEDPLSVRELAMHVGVSLRQLERMFHDYLQCTPTSYYVELRLRRARQLLTRSDKPIADIAMACGFVSLAHFTNRYSTYFGISPGAERRRLAGG
jgi:transcriptional regulator GlxA family with amidase domain